MSEASKSIKCVVVGDVVGKTYMIESYTTGVCPSEFIPTVLEKYTATVTVNSTLVQLEVVDTSGLEDYDRIRPESYSQTDVFLVCFSIMSPYSFESVRNRWVPEIRHHCPDIIPVILVGTKSDQRDDDKCLQELAAIGLSPITHKQGEKLVRKVKARMYLECSAVTQQGLQRVFEEAAKVAIGPAPAPKQKKKACVLL